MKLRESKKHERIICEIRQFTTPVGAIRNETWYRMKENRFSNLHWDFLFFFVRLFQMLFTISSAMKMVLCFANSENCILWYQKTATHQQHTYKCTEMLLQSMKILFTQQTNQFVLFNEFPYDTSYVWQTEINWSIFPLAWLEHTCLERCFAYKK